ncbi:LPXTG cell wall anchor domain-containing protein [Limosilactobacillus oris]|uniref:LPXTG cell wall anchor domain-containing protein n=1 Tax=Limosilactobacillus oris TaxID=1632 RepID=UPI0022358090|nr:LPXTG cell wall anchor domain-containing protein [Limosilactobacillus oris]MCW4388040.1 LPXTG cell wall anchor domain-containing protein [Limosilactobacillus oris]
MDGVTYTIGDNDSTLEQPVISVNTPSGDDSHNQPSTNNQTGGQTTNTQLPAGAKVVNGRVVDAHGNVLSGWTVVNGQAVRNENAVAVNADGQVAASAKRLPQTGSNDSLALAGLGAASLLGMFGLAGLNKKRG